MWLKVCGLRRPADALLAAELGADWLGVLVGQTHASPDFVSPQVARSIVEAVRARVGAQAERRSARVMLVTHRTDVAEIAALVTQVGADGVQLHGGSSPASVGQLAEALPGVAKFVAVHVTGPEVLDAGEPFAAHVEGFVLDSINARTGQVGGTGLVHDWTASRDFVARYPASKVWLAGGLHAGNVQQAIRRVRPAGVDVNSGTKGADGFKDAVRLRAFVRAARAAAT